ncbi:hypothetical protein [Dubosiella newyorkensis]|uniref:hypothetical protein n=3 Tax=Dubosiella newyorkensis TaxID=1862672 RepID=UPI00272ACA19|nr:hypothetical protein [Dubosiella newyorkensis]
MRKKHGKSPTKSRIRRGLYRSDMGKLINGDVNAVLQILKKVVPNTYANGIEGIGLSPVKLNLSLNAKAVKKTLIIPDWVNIQALRFQT